MGDFASALSSRPAPKRLGDVVLRYEPSMLIGETPLPLASLTPSIVWLMGVTAMVLGTASLLLGGSDWLTLLALLATATLFTLAFWVERRGRRRRVFVVNFTTTSLRLDFVTPFAGRPRTMVVHFDGVRALTRMATADGRECLTVDFVTSADSQTLLREVLVARIVPAEREAVDRLERVLSGAFGLGEPLEPVDVSE